MASSAYLDVKYDPEIKPTAAPFGLSAEEQVQVGNEAFEDCLGIYLTEVIGRVTSLNEVRAEAYIFMRQIMLAFDKRRCGLMTPKGKPIKKGKHGLAYYFTGYFRIRCQLIRVNARGKNGRRQAAVEKYMGDPEDEIAVQASRFVDKDISNSFEISSDIARFLEGLPVGADEFVVDCYINDMSRTDLKQKYKKMFAVYERIIRRHAKKLNREGT